MITECELVRSNYPFRDSMTGKYNRSQSFFYHLYLRLNRLRIENLFPNNKCINLTLFTEFIKRKLAAMLVEETRPNLNIYVVHTHFTVKL